MSTASRVSSRARRYDAGYTFVEVALVIVIIAVMSILVERSLASTQEAERYLDGVRRVTERGQRVGYEVRDMLSASRRLFHRDAVGLGYLDALFLERDVIAPGARLPLIDELNPLRADEDLETYVGNMLLFVRESDPAPCVANAALKRMRSIDTYRFVLVCPAVTDRRLFANRPAAVDLLVWKSVPFPSYTQIMNLDSSAERSSVCNDLVNRYGYDYAWNPTAAVDAAFFKLGSTGVAASPTTSMSIDEDDEISEGGRLVYTNVQLAQTDPDSYHRRSLLTADDPADWTPNGFEVKVVGRSGSRKVWIRLAIEAQAGGRVAVHAGSQVVSTKDM